MLDFDFEGLLILVRGISKLFHKSQKPFHDSPIQTILLFSLSLSLYQAAPLLQSFDKF